MATMQRKRAIPKQGSDGAHVAMQPIGFISGQIRKNPQVPGSGFVEAAVVHSLFQPDEVDGSRVAHPIQQVNREDASGPAFRGRPMAANASGSKGLWPIGRLPHLCAGKIR